MYNKHLYVKSLNCFKRVVVSVADNDKKDRIYLLTNWSDHVKKIIADYMLRWKIENFHKDAKQHLGLGKVQLRNIEGIKKHWYLVFLAHSLLRLGVRVILRKDSDTEHRVESEKRMYRTAGRFHLLDRELG